MSNFKLQKIGTYKTAVATKSKMPMIQITLDPKQVAKIKEWDMGKIYIYDPQDVGEILGLIGGE